VDYYVIWWYRPTDDRPTSCSILCEHFTRVLPFLAADQRIFTTREISPVTIIFTLQFACPLLLLLTFRLSVRLWTVFVWPISNRVVYSVSVVSGTVNFSLDRWTSSVVCAPNIFHESLPNHINHTWYIKMILTILWPTREHYHVPTKMLPIPRISYST